MELEHRKGFKQPEAAFPKLHFIPMGPYRKLNAVRAIWKNTEMQQLLTNSKPFYAALGCSYMPALSWDLNQLEYQHYDLCLPAPLLLGPHHSTLLPGV